MGIIDRLKELISLEESVPTIELTEGGDAVIEIGRSGTFQANKGGEVKLTPDDLKQIAASFTEPEEHLLKIGHVKIETDTPHYGNVTALAYDESSDRLKATIRPTPALVRRNREEGFRRVSMELARTAEKGFQFLHTAFLGARRPAIRGLAEVALAEGAEVFCFADGDEEIELAIVSASEKKAVETPKKEGGLTGDATIEGRTKEIEMSDVDKARLEELENQLKESKLKLEESRKQLAELAESEVARFMEDPKIVERVPLTVRPKASALLSALAVDAAEGEMIEFSEGKETKKVTLFDLAKAVIAGMSAQVSADEKTRKASPPAGEEVDDTVGAEFSGADPDSTVFHLSAQKEINAAKAKGEEISYFEALRRVEMADIAGKK